MLVQSVSTRRFTHWNQAISRCKSIELLELNLHQQHPGQFNMAAWLLEGEKILVLLFAVILCANLSKFGMKLAKLQTDKKLPKHCASYKTEGNCAWAWLFSTFYLMQKQGYHGKFHVFSCHRTPGNILQIVPNLCWPQNHNYRKFYPHLSIQIFPDCSMTFPDLE